MDPSKASQKELLYFINKENQFKKDSRGYVQIIEMYTLLGYVFVYNCYILQDFPPPKKKIRLCRLQPLSTIV